MTQGSDRKRLRRVFDLHPGLSSAAPTGLYGRVASGLRSACCRRRFPRPRFAGSMLGGAHPWFRSKMPAARFRSPSACGGLSTAAPSGAFGGTTGCARRQPFRSPESNAMACANSWMVKRYKYYSPGSRRTGRTGKLDRLTVAPAVCFWLSSAAATGAIRTARVSRRLPSSFEYIYILPGVSAGCGVRAGRGLGRSGARAWGVRSVRGNTATVYVDVPHPSGWRAVWRSLDRRRGFRRRLPVARC